ncbi:MAG: FAD-binding oxidoreductase [Deltaproteobacteria bacterium]|nr:FAD-binding oxidoreductase [Deltaproteobacteria bacterium]
MTLKVQLEKIVGPQNVFDDQATLVKYSKDQSFVSPAKPDFVIFPQSTEEIQEITRLANQTKTPLIPFSSGLNFYGATIPSNSGIIINLSKMDKILSIDEENWFVVVEPGVTYEQLQDELSKNKLRAMIPLGVSPKRTVLSSTLERDPALAAASFEYGNDLMLDTEIILPEGDLFRTGLWASGGRPGSHMGPVRALLYRFFTAAQGTFGIMTKMALQVEYLPELREIFFIPFSSLTDSLEAIKQIQRKEIGLECFLLNRFNLASLFCKDWNIPQEFPSKNVPSEHFKELIDVLPPWVLIICLTGSPRFPEEKISYEKDALMNISSKLNINVFSTIPPLENADKYFSGLLIRPWDILKKFCFKGSVHSLSFKSPLKRVPEFESIIHKASEEHNYSIRHIGGYLLPIERGRAVHLEFDFHCDISNPEEVKQVRDLYFSCSEELIKMGAFFDRPYGDWAEMMYKRTGTYTKKLKELKDEIDPHHIMNPGKLCF